MFAAIGSNPRAWARGAVPRPIRGRADLRLRRCRNHMIGRAADVLTCHERSCRKLVESFEVMFAKMSDRIGATASESR
jgi:hypothetical protein